MIDIICALCGRNQQTEILYPANFNKANISSYIYSARRLPDEIHYQIVRCKNCGLIFSNPIIDPNKIFSFYSKSKFTYNLEASYIRKTYGYYLNTLLSQDGRSKIKLLEIGCGNGFFLEEAKKMGISNVYGIEPSKLSVDKAVPWLKKRIKVDVLQQRLYSHNSFDIICCFHTLDHIVNIDAFLRETYLLLKKTGKVFFIVHDASGLSVKLFGEKSPIFDIEHIYLFNPKTLSKIFSKYGFKKIKIIAIKNTYPLLYWFRMIPISLVVKKLILKFLKVTNLGFIPFSLKAGNIGIIAQK